MEAEDVKEEKGFEFAYTLIPKSACERYNFSANNSFSGGASGNVFDFSSKALPDWIKFERCTDTNDCLIFFKSNKRSLESNAESYSEKFMFNRSFMSNEFTLRILSFDIFLTGDLAFLMTLLGQHNQSHVKCLLCDLQNSNKSNQKLAWQNQE